MKNVKCSWSFAAGIRAGVALFGVAFFVQACVPSWADPSLPTLFSDHMVLQQGREIQVWGNADPGEKITVQLATHSAAATADARGKWAVRLPVLPVGGPFTLTVRGKKEIVVRDVMIGEVWLASGQSNMTFSLSGAEGADTEVPQANYPEIRLFTVPRKIALSPQENTRAAHWEICTPETAKEFSAVAYFFGRELLRHRNVPIGLVESAWPGTAIEEWIDADAIRRNPEIKDVAKELDQASAAERDRAENAQALDLQFDDFQLIPAASGNVGETLANFDDGTARLTTGGSFSYSWSDAGDSSFDLLPPGRGGTGLAARVSGQVDGTQDAILAANYRLDNATEDLTAYIGIRFWVRGSGSFRFRSKQPTITDYDDYATPLLKATSAWQQVTVMFRDLHQDGWGVVHDFTPVSLTGFSFECLPSSGYVDRPVSGLYEGMITPLLGYQFRGALWYQGESNALKAHQYRTLLPTLISNWRSAFQQPNLEFLIVQLPNHGAIPAEPSESAWAEMREAEWMTVQDVPHTGMAVTIDVGDPNDLHPHKKKEVGERLALWALGTIYKEPIEYSGPLFASMKIDGTVMRLQFTHTGSGIEARGDSVLHGFALAGEDRKFHWADARIEGNTIVVSSAEVRKPAAVRYAWGDSPICNLFNKDGLPASPFRTDHWPGITEGTQ
jgi:sialate O-acetylesterase